MDVPPAVSVNDMSGSYTLSKTLSDSSQAVLKMQNVAFIIRQAVQYSTVTVTLKQYTDAQGRVHLDQEQVSTGGIKNNEERVLDGNEENKENKIWGKVKGRSSLKPLSEISDSYLTEGWGQDAAGKFIWSINESLTDGWTTEQVFGFAEVDGKRRHVRRVFCRKGAKEERMRLVYDWKA